MGQDFNSVCDKHKEYYHLGQFMGGISSFGYGSKDEMGREDAADFI
jgi:hypothetical protein